MARTGPSRSVDPSLSVGRTRKAKAFHEAARLLAENVERIGDGDVVAANAVLAAVAYTDALTAAFGGLLNQKDHAAAAKLLRHVLGNALPDGQERRLTRLLGRKDETAYGSGMGRIDEVRQLVESLDQFGDWATGMLLAKKVKG